MLSLTQTLVALAPHDVQTSGAPADYSAVSTDSRNVRPGELFIALRGEKFDGHDFVADVLARGAAAAVVDRRWHADHPGAGQALLVVDDTRRAFASLAAAWRAGFGIPVIGVVGSNGKTTVKEMIAAILAAAHGTEGRLATTGNLNNDIGVPTMLLRLTAAHRAAVIEMGMNHPGETAELAAAARPTVALINNAQREHQEFMKTVAAVAEEHADVLRALPVDGVAVLNADDAFFPLWQQVAAPRKVLSFGLAAGADVRGEPGSDGLQLVTPQGSACVRLQTLGEHNVRNALGAAAAALAAGCALSAVVAGLEAFTPVKGRLQRHVGHNGATVIDDSYNANPDSVRAAIDVLAATPGHRLLVLGDMGEVGDQGPEYHSEVGAYAAERGIDGLLTLGDMSAAASRAFGSGATHFDSIAALLTALQPQLAANTTVLIKGSRFMRMERVLEAITDKAREHHAA